MTTNRDPLRAAYLALGSGHDPSAAACLRRELDRRYPIRRPADDAVWATLSKVNPRPMMRAAYLAVGGGCDPDAAAILRRELDCRYPPTPKDTP